MSKVPEYVKKAIQRGEELKSGGNQAGFFKIERGVDNMARLVPFINSEQEEWLNIEYRHHFIDGTIPCRKHFGEHDCPICNLSDYLENHGIQELAGKLKAKNHFVFNVLSKDSELQLLECGSMLSTAIFSIFADEEYGNIADPKTGRYIKIRKSGTGFDTNYTALPSIKSSPLPKGINPINLDAWLRGKELTSAEMIKLIESKYNYDYSEISSGSDNEDSNSSSKRAESVNSGKYTEEELRKKTKAELRSILTDELEVENVAKSWNTDKLVNLILNDGLPF